MKGKGRGSTKNKRNSNKRVQQKRSFCDPLFLLRYAEEQNEQSALLSLFFDASRHSAPMFLILPAAGTAAARRTTLNVDVRRQALGTRILPPFEKYSGKMIGFETSWPNAEDNLALSRAMRIMSRMTHSFFCQIKLSVVSSLIV
jgi:hypothetical protein